VYSPTVRRLVAELPNQGRLPDSASATVDNPICGDVLELYVKTENGVITESCFQASGCPAVIAAGAAITIMVKGKPIAVARQIEVGHLIDFLEQLPAHKRHGAEMAVRALRMIIDN